MSTDMKMSDPWHPVTDPVTLKHLGKLLEELGEATAAVSRCLIQGIDECDPITKKPNREWVEDELADVAAGIALNVNHFGLNKTRMTHRTNQKIMKLHVWHKGA